MMAFSAVVASFSGWIWKPLPLPEPAEDLLALNKALSKLVGRHPREAELVQLLYFGGLTLPEAEHLPTGRRRTRPRPPLSDREDRQSRRRQRRPRLVVAVRETTRFGSRGSGPWSLEGSRPAPRHQEFRRKAHVAFPKDRPRVRHFAQLPPSVQTREVADRR